jgi:hypothetical protein
LSLLSVLLFEVVLVLSKDSASSRILALCSTSASILASTFDSTLDLDSVSALDFTSTFDFDYDSNLLSVFA